VGGKFLAKGHDPIFSLEITSWAVFRRRA